MIPGPEHDLKRLAHTIHTMTTSTTTLTATQQLIYSRTRIVSAASKIDPELYGSIEPRDILSISLEDGKVICSLSDGEIAINRSAVIANFWEHRTRTPSFFDYKVWRQVKPGPGEYGVAVGAIDYSIVPNKIAVTSNGVRKVYFVDEVNKTCTCGSWKQLNESRKELSDEFKTHGECCFEVTCKHLKWAEANTRLQADNFLAKNKSQEYNPRICVYSFDHRHGLLRYRVTYDGIKDKGQWFPVDGWKEKHVYGPGGIPNGECWDTFFSALNQEDPFKLVPFSQTLAALLNSSSKKN